MNLDLKKIEEIPANVKKKLFGLRDFEGAYIISKLIKDKKKILNIGCLWGRDYYFLSSGLNKNVVNLDLGKQEVPNLVIGDITKKTLFKDNEFDAVIMGDIIEHIFEDFGALAEIRRILKSDGILVLSIPYFDDKPDYHVRMHSEKTMRRLLESSGFKVTETLTRGGLISLSKILAAPSLILSKLSEKYRIKYLSAIAEADYYLGRKKFYLLRFSKSYGGYFLAKKSVKKDFIKINRKSFIRNEEN